MLPLSEETNHNVGSRPTPNTWNSNRDTITVLWSIVILVTTWCSKPLQNFPTVSTPFTAILAIRPSPCSSWNRVLTWCSVGTTFTLLLRHLRTCLEGKSTETCFLLVSVWHALTSLINIESRCEAVVPAAMIELNLGQRAQDNSS